MLKFMFMNSVLLGCMVFCEVLRVWLQVVQIVFDVRLMNWLCRYVVISCGGYDFISELMQLFGRFVLLLQVLVWISLYRFCRCGFLCNCFMNCWKMNLKFFGVVVMFMWLCRLFILQCICVMILCQVCWVLISDRMLSLLIRDWLILKLMMVCGFFMEWQMIVVWQVLLLYR